MSAKLPSAVPAAAIVCLLGAGTLSAAAAPPPSPGAGGPPTRTLVVERAVADGALKVRVFAAEMPHEGRRMAFWVYVTEGLKVHRQRELVMAVARRAKEAVKAFPEDPITFFAGVLDDSVKGRPALEGGMTRLPEGKFLGRDDLGAVLYMRPDPLRSALLQPDTLLALPLTDTEVLAAESFGQLRVLALLGAHHRVFPWAAFFDRDRPSLAAEPERWDTVLRKTEMARIRGIRAAVELPASISPAVGHGTLVVSLPSSGRQVIEVALKTDAKDGVAFPTELDPESDALAVYRPGQKSPVATRASENPVQRLSGAFVAFQPGAEEDHASLFEDGFLVRLTEESRRRLLEAVALGTDLTLLGAPSSLAIRIKWRD
jgi:hypothetical protein